MKKIIAFDCDSTLSAIEGVDELARLAGDDIFRQVENLTNQAMNGEVPVEEVFARRLDLIKPTRQQCKTIGQMYLEQIEPTARETIAALQADDWECLIISGGFAPCIGNIAQELNIRRIEAVPLRFDASGNYLGFDENYPTTRDGGKPDIIAQLKRELDPDIIVMVGDGVSDLETKPLVDHFIGFSRYVEREKVAKNCVHNVKSLSHVLDLLNKM
jgi:phosphoserine phosphatase